MSNPHTHNNKCAVHDCARRTHFDRSRFCGMHMARYDRNGHPVAMAIPDQRFDEFSKMIDRGLCKYANSKAYSAALRLADDLLNFEPPARFNVYLDIERRMKALQGEGVTPSDVVRRVCAYFAYTRLHPRPDQRSDDYGLARAVVRLAPLGKWRPNSRLLKFLGPEIRERLSVFTNAFLDRVEADEAERRALKDASRDFTTT